MEEPEEFQVGLNFVHDPFAPFLHTRALSLYDALDVLEQAPASTIEFWDGENWETVFDGSLEFTGVKPENWI